MKHAEKLEKIKLYQRYIEFKRTKGKTQAYETLEKELEKLKKRIKEETRKSREKAKELYQKRKTPTFSTSTSSLSYKFHNTSS